MRDYCIELKKRIDFIRGIVKSSGAEGIVFGNSGGKDSALAGILCKMACDNTVGIILPCESKRNFNEDLNDGLDVAEKFSIATKTVDLTALKTLVIENLKNDTQLTTSAISNIAPRLRMLTLYTIAASENRLVAGTGNKSEIYMGYYTKWGDGAYDFNPIGDLTVTEIYEFLKFLDAPENIIKKAPSAGLYEGQSDEKDMGVSYASIDKYIKGDRVSAEERTIIERYHRRNEHKRKPPVIYSDNGQ